jgi:hypothetical protein
LKSTENHLRRDLHFAGVSAKSGEIHRAGAKPGAGNAVSDATVRRTTLLKAKREFEKSLIAKCAVKDLVPLT